MSTIVDAAYAAIVVFAEVLRRQAGQYSISEAGELKRMCMAWLDDDARTTGKPFVAEFSRANVEWEYQIGGKLYDTRHGDSIEAVRRGKHAPRIATRARRRRSVIDLLGAGESHLPSYMGDTITEIPAADRVLDEAREYVAAGGSDSAALFRSANLYLGQAQRANNTRFRDLRICDQSVSYYLALGDRRYCQRESDINASGASVAAALDRVNDHDQLDAVMDIVGYDRATP